MFDRWSAGWLLLVVVVGLAASACAGRAPGRAPARPAVLDVQEGLASYYGPGFHGKVTASGRRFDMNQLVAAHPRYPFGTEVRVTNLRNGRSVRVRVIDRGPAIGPRQDGVIVDLSRRAAQALDFVQDGRARVRLEVLRWGVN
jgi:rare lipoprotein A